MIALSVLTMGFLGLIALLSRSLSLNRVVARSYVGTYLAAEGIELVKAVIDANISRGDAWDCNLPGGGAQYEIDYTDLAGITSCGTAPPSVGRGALQYSDADGYQYQNGDNTEFTRTITLSYPAVDHLQVRSVVSWSGGSDRVELEDFFTDWRP